MGTILGSVLMSLPPNVITLSLDAHFGHKRMVDIYQFVSKVEKQSLTKRHPESLTVRIWH